MAAPFRRRANDAEGIAPRRPQAGVLRRERRALLKAREDALRDLGGLLVEMYRRGGFRDDLLVRAGGDGDRDRRPPRGDRGAAARPPARPALRVRRAAAPRIALLPELRPASSATEAASEETIVEPAPSRPDGRDEAAERETAIAAADETCPRCGARREQDQRYCLDCGLQLPEVTGRLPSLRRRWIRRFGWYPGDWVWVSLLTLVVAVGGRGGGDRAHRVGRERQRADARRRRDP